MNGGVNARWVAAVDGSLESLELKIKRDTLILKVKCIENVSLLSYWCFGQSHLCDQTLIRGSLLETYPYFMRRTKCRLFSTVGVHAFIVLVHDHQVSHHSPAFLIDLGCTRLPQVRFSTKRLARCLLLTPATLILKVKCIENVSLLSYWCFGQSHLCDQTLIRGSLLETYPYFMRRTKCRLFSTVGVHAFIVLVHDHQVSHHSPGFLIDLGCRRLPQVRFSTKRLARCLLLTPATNGLPLPNLYGFLSISTRLTRKASLRAMAVIAFWLLPV